MAAIDRAADIILAHTIYETGGSANRARHAAQALADAGLLADDSTPLRDAVVDAAKAARFCLGSAETAVTKHELWLAVDALLATEAGEP